MSARIIPFPNRRRDAPVMVRNGWPIFRRPDGVLEMRDPRLTVMEAAYAGERPCDTEQPA